MRAALEQRRAALLKAQADAARILLSLACTRHAPQRTHAQLSAAHERNIELGG